MICPSQWSTCPAPETIITTLKLSRPKRRNSGSARARDLTSRVTRSFRRLGQANTRCLARSVTFQTFRCQAAALKASIFENLRSKKVRAQLQSIQSRFRAYRANDQCRLSGRQSGLALEGACRLQLACPLYQYRQLKAEPQNISITSYPVVLC